MQSRRRGGGGGHTLSRECRLHHQAHAHAPQRVVLVRDHVTVRHQLVAVAEVPDEVNRSRRLQVAAGVVELDLEDDVLATDENRRVHRSLLGDVDRQGDLIYGIR